MKSNRKTKQTADLVDVRKNGEGVTYKCLRCGFEMESNVYYEPTYKSMLEHAATCEGKKMDIAIRPQQTNAAALNEHAELLAVQIKACVPNGGQLNNNEAIALARISMATDLSPFTGELYYIPGKGPGVGIRGLRRKAKEQSLYSLAAPRSMTSAEAEEHNVRPGDVGYICELWRHDRTREAAEINHLLGQASIPIASVIGMGIWRKAYKEIGQYKDDPIPHGKSPAWVAKKRAEADALNQAYDIGINLPYSDVADDHIEISEDDDAGWSVVPDGDEEIIRRQAALNAERAAQAPSSVVEKYGEAGQRPLPAWVEELRHKIAQDPQVSDPVSNSFAASVKATLDRRGIMWERGKSFVKALLGHHIEEATIPEAREIMNLCNDPELVSKIAEVLG